MAEQQQSTQEVVEREMERGGVPPEQKMAEEQAATYKVVGSSKIATSSRHGNLWKSRRDRGISKLRQQHMLKAWQECIRYYNNHQVPERVSTDGKTPGNDHLSAKMSRAYSETENIVFANTSATVPAVYAKNPQINITVGDADEEDLPVSPRLIEDVINTVMSKRAEPGVNLKPIMRRAVVHTTLTNIAYVECSFTKREQSNQQAYDDLVRLSEKIATTDDQDIIRETEGELEALERTFDFIKPAGPAVRFLRSDQLIRDPDSVRDDLQDCNWLMYDDYLPTEFIQARFAMKSSEGSEDAYKSIYEPTHVMNLNDGTSQSHNKSMTAPDEIFSFSLLEDHDKDGTQSPYEYYGYDSNESYKHALRTRVWYVWDKVTRRLYLYNDKDWTWPIWVWDDPYNLEGFYPVAPLSFYTDPEQGTGKSEVMYYLDQQDSLNEINSEMKQARHWARRNLFYDKNKIDRNDVEKLLEGDKDTAVGVDVPEGMKLNEMVEAFLPPSTSFIELFDKQPIIAAIDRVSSVRDTQRGAEFKTNTTNMAIENYSSGQQMRLDEKIDAVEDCIGLVGWILAQMCLQFMDQETAKKLVGPKKAAQWSNLSPDEITQYYRLTVVGGSTLKPTSQAQKKIAIEVGQVLGQFASAAPQAVTAIMLRLFNRAFDEVEIKDDEWEALHNAIGSTGITGDGGNAGAGAAGPNDPAADPIAQLEQLVDQLPPEAKQALGTAMARGVPVREALERILGATQQAA